MHHRYVSYSDESSLGDKYTIIGGVVCRDSDAKWFRTVIAEAQGRFPDKLKWERIRRNNADRYKILIGHFLCAVRARRIDFHALVVDRDKADHDQYNQGDSELGFNKFVIQHLFQIRKDLGSAARIRHMYASRSSPHALDKFGEYVNGMARNRWGWRAAACLSVDHVPYDKESMFWISDIMIGAIGAAYNQRLTPGGPKAEIAEHIRSEAALTSIAAPTKRSDLLDIWQIKLGPPKT